MRRGAASREAGIHKYGYIQLWFLSSFSSGRASKRPWILGLESSKWSERLSVWLSG